MRRPRARNGALRTSAAIIVLLLAVVTSGIVWISLASRRHDAVDEATTVDSVLATRDTGSVPIDTGPGWSTIDDPTADGWSTEVFSESAAAQLKVIGRLLASEAAPSASDVTSLIAAPFDCSTLLPKRLDKSFEDETFSVERSVAGHEEPVAARDAGGFAASIDELRSALGGNTTRTKFKIVGVTRQQARIATKQRVEISGRTARGFVEMTAYWNALWTIPQETATPTLRRLAVARVEIVTRKLSTPLLEDCTPSVLGANPSFAAQLGLGMNHWLERIQDRRFFALLGTPGVAIGDVNGDGLDDIYLCQEGGLPNRLFVQSPDGSAMDVSEASGADWLESSRSALLVDLDNDAHQDLVVTVLGLVVIARGDGKGRFAVLSLVPTSEDTMSLSAADFDEDGDLDIYVCAYKRDDLSHDSGVLSLGSSSAFVYHDANNAATNLLLRNDIDRSNADAEWRFADVTADVGLDVNNRRFSFAAAWEDHDLDGDLDLYVANDFGRNTFYRNDSDESGARHFVEIATHTNAEDSASGMSVTWGDYDRDGRPDVYISNMFSAAGGRITSQREFKPNAPGEVRERLRRFARGNTLLRATEGGLFEDTSVAAGVTMGRWAWGSNFADLNNDGWDDLVVANGYITTDDTGDL